MTLIHSAVTVDSANGLPHGTVKRAPQGFAHAILLDQMGNEAKWYVLDLYGSMETETDRDVADWPIVYVPAPDEVWQAMNTQPSYRDHVAEEFGKDEGPLVSPEEQADQEYSSADPPGEGRRYPISAFVIPCKNCEHKKWLHNNTTGKCVARPPGMGVCECPGFEDVPEPDLQPVSPEFIEQLKSVTSGPEKPLFACLCGHWLHDHREEEPHRCLEPACPCVGFKEDA